jgi:hypothetical protein
MYFVQFGCLWFILQSKGVGWFFITFHFNGYQPIPFQAGNGMIPGFIEGLEQLSFGDKAIIFIPSVWDMGQQVQVN